MASRGGPEVGIVSPLLDELTSVAVGQVQVEENECLRSRAEAAPRVREVVCDLDQVAGSFERGSHHPRVGGAVFYQEDTLPEGGSQHLADGRDHAFSIPGPLDDVGVSSSLHPFPLVFL